MRIVKVKHKTTYYDYDYNPPKPHEETHLIIDMTLEEYDNYNFLQREWRLKNAGKESK